MTGRLYAGALAATLADVAAYLALIVPGRVTESNPLVGSLAPSNALGARAATLVLLGALVVLSSIVPSRPLAVAVAIALVAAIVVGLLGFASTVGAIR